MNKEAQRRRFLQGAMLLLAFALTPARAADPIARQAQVSDALVAANTTITVSASDIPDDAEFVPLNFRGTAGFGDHTAVSSRSTPAQVEEAAFL